MSLIAYLEMARHGQIMKTKNDGDVKVVADGVMDIAEWKKMRPDFEFYRGDSKRFKVNGFPRGTYTASIGKAYRADGTEITQAEIDKQKEKNEKKAAKPKKQSPVVTRKIEKAKKLLKERPTRGKNFYHGKEGNYERKIISWLDDVQDSPSDYVPLQGSVDSGKWITYNKLDKLYEKSMDAYNTHSTAGKYGMLDGIAQFPARISDAIDGLGEGDEAFIDDHWGKDAY